MSGELAENAGGIGEWIEDGLNGRLVPQADPAALAHALADVLRQPERLVQMGQWRVRRRFNSPGQRSPTVTLRLRSMRSAGLHRIGTPVVSFERRSHDIRAAARELAGGALPASIRLGLREAGTDFTQVTGRPRVRREGFK
jgi:hypothetical protein